MTLLSLVKVMFYLLFVFCVDRKEKIAIFEDICFNKAALLLSYLSPQHKVHSTLYFASDSLTAE